MDDDGLVYDSPTDGGVVGDESWAAAVRRPWTVATALYIDVRETEASGEVAQGDDPGQSSLHHAALLAVIVVMILVAIGFAGASVHFYRRALPRIGFRRAT